MAEITDERWALLVDAALEYSTYRPQLLYQAWEPVAGSIEQNVPAGVLGIESIEYGEEFSLTEIYTATTEQGWCYANSKLYLVPAPVDTTPIVVVWRSVHVADELERSFPTIPPDGMLIVQLLADAAEAEEQQAAVDAGLSSYTIGGTTVKWAQSGGGGISRQSLATRLRQRALSALSGVAADWG